VLAAGDPVLVRKCARLFASEFVPVVPTLLAHPSEASLLCLKAVFNSIPNQLAVLRQLVHVSPDTALLCLSTAACDMTVRYPSVEIDGIALDLRRCSLISKLKFFARTISINEIPDDLWRSEHEGHQEAKWMLRLARELPTDKMLQVHHDLAPRFPNECFDSFLTVLATKELSADMFRQLGSVFKNRNPMVRERALKSVHETLKTPKTRIHFLAFIGLALEDAQLNQLAESFLRYHVELRELVPSAIAPEFAIPAFFNLVIFFDRQCSSLSSFLSVLSQPLVHEICSQMARQANSRSQFGQRLIGLCNLASEITGRQERPTFNMSLPDTFIQDLGNELDDTISTRKLGQARCL
jgi:hypothetical protein